jgi:FAD:protein FMN transferase
MKTLMHRRTFIKSLCILCSSLTVKSWAAPLIDSDLGSTLHRVSETKTQMGTFVTITLFHPSQEKAREIIEAAFLQMEKLIHFYNRHEEGSPLSYLNRQGYLNDPPPELLAILQRAREFHSRSRGVFDVTVKPILDLYEESYLLGRLPESATLRETLSRVGFSNLKVHRKNIAFQKEGMGLTLDGMAKGTVVDGTINFLRKKGVEHALVEAGGDLRVIGGRGLNSPWRIAVYNPHQEKEAQEPIRLSEGAVATSGCYFVSYDSRQDHFHILSPETGFSPPWSTSATVIAPTAEAADGLATSLMLLSPEQGLSFVNRHENLAAMIITRKGHRLRSSRWPGFEETNSRRINHG